MSDAIEARSGDFGGRLRQAREAKGVTLRDIAHATKISLRSLEALELNDPSKLPGGVFTRAFVRSYAEFVGLDPEATVRDFLQRFPQEADLLPHRPETDSARRSLDVIGLGPVWLVGVTGAVAVLILLGFWIAGTSSSAQPHETRSPAPPEDRTTPVARDAGDDDVAAVRFGGSGPPPDATASVVAHAAPGESETLTIEIRPTGQCWVSLTVDGELQFERLMSPGEREVRTARNGIVVQVGDAASFDFSINDRPGRTLGASGKAVTARIDRENLNRFVAQ